jgi:imidazole glycerol-phosphate synthase subunit HisH
MIGIIDYQMGNIQSVVNAFEYLSLPVCILKDPNACHDVSHIVLPGVGAFGEGIANLHNLGFSKILHDEIIENRKPFLGICLGMQLICRESFEFGHFFGLGWIDASVRHFDPSWGIKIPHVGWNNLLITRPNRLFCSFKENLNMYFVHSYYVDALSHDFSVAHCEYGRPFTAAIEKDNIFGVQFHPEKSQNNGLEMLKRFSAI